MNIGQSSVHSTRRSTEYGRFKVDVSNTAFWEGLGYRTDSEIEALPNGSVRVYKFTCTRDFILQKQSLSCDEGALRLRAYRDTQGAESGDFDQNVPIRKLNLMSVAPDIPTSTAINYGGAFTPTGSEKPVEVIRVRTSGATSQQATVTGVVGDERGLPAGTYYLVIDNFANSGAASGVYSLVWEERSP